MSAVWKDIIGFEGSYQVSSEGKVRSLDRWVRAGKGRRLLRGMLVKQQMKKDGYFHIVLSKSQVGVTRAVHALVAQAFRGPRLNGLDVRHRDGVKTNNREDNLIYGTRQENIDDKLTHGTMARGSTINTSKLNECQVIDMRHRRFGGEGVVELSESFGVSTVAVSKICLGDNWRHVGGPIMKREQRIMKVTA